MNWLLFTSIVLIVIISCSGEKGCPEKDEIHPCTCLRADNPPNLKYMWCDGIIESETLRRIFKNSARHSFFQVHIKNSVLNYIPHEVFDEIEIYKLYISNLTLTDIFDEPPKELKSLKEFALSDTKVLRGVIWQLLGPLTELEHLDVFNVSVKVIKQDFSQYASKSLKRIIFSETDTRSVKKDVFQKFVNLEEFYLDYGKLTEIRRDFFPTPFNNIRIIAFNGHSLESLPDGMFTDMPNLKLLGLKFNNITLVNSAAFGGRADHMKTIDLGGNPLRCDCRIKWLLDHQPETLIGGCDSPARLKGKSLRQLTDEDFDC